MNTPGGETDRLLRRLTSRRALARAAILFERIWPALWPAVGVAGLFVCVALLDLPRLLPPWAHIGLLAVTGLLIVGLAGRAGSTASPHRTTRPPTAGWRLPPACPTARSPC